MSTIGRSASRCRISRSNSRPLRSGRLTSSRSRSNGSRSSRARPASAVSAEPTEYPSEERRSSRPSRISASSSMTRIEPLGMNRFPYGRKLQSERGAFTRGRAHLDLARMIFDAAIAAREAQTRTTARRLGGEEWIENAGEIFALNAGSGVRYFDFHCAVIRGAAHFQHASGRHRIFCVQKKIEKNLLQAIARAQNQRQIALQVSHNLHVCGAERMSGESQRFFNNLVQIHFLETGAARP